MAACGQRVILAVIVFMLSSAASALETTIVPAGEVVPFWLSPKGRNKGPQKPLEVASFEAMKYPVTVGQYQDFLRANRAWQKSQVAKIFADASYLKSIDTEKARAPITWVSWFAARAFCESHGMRLPTLVEWEYMAAASEKKRDANRDEKFLRRILDWYGEPQQGSLKPVGSIYQNIYGLWDMHGLIWEWVDDFNSAFVTGESREDSSFNKDMFCGSGGMTGANKEDYAAFMRFAFRSSLKGNSNVWNLGFRCVRSK